MADTSIEWTDKSWNMIGAYYGDKRGWMCSKPSTGCKNCYSEAMNLRLGNGLRYTPENVAKVDLRLVNLDEPFRWRKPQKVFVCSMTDLFHEAVPFAFIGAVFGVMMATRQHTYQILTKRPERAREFFDWLSKSASDGELTECEEVEEMGLQHLDDVCHLQANTSQWPLPNVWIGVSVENQEQAKTRIPQLLKIPATVRFLSCEPLLGPIDFDQIKIGCGYRPLYCGCSAECEHAKIDWVIAGGESGSKARPSHPDWFRSLRDQCKKSWVSFFFKQWGEIVEVDEERPTQQLDWDEMPQYPLTKRSLLVAPDGEVITMNDEPRAEVPYRWMERVGKKSAGRILDGRTWDEFPEVA